MRLNRELALKIILESIEPDSAVISTTGLISREIYEKYDSERCFYMPGSMGLASSIGVGIAESLTRQERTKKVYVIDGDSACLMNLGTLATEGMRKPRNLVHIVLDNHAYGSCSEEKSLARYVQLNEVARASGCNKAFRVSSTIGLKDAIIVARATEKFVFIDVEIDLGGRRDFKRPLDMPFIAERFRSFLQKGEANDLQGQPDV